MNEKTTNKAKRDRLVALHASLTATLLNGYLAHRGCDLEALHGDLTVHAIDVSDCILDILEEKYDRMYPD